jgi:serine/threonine-protein kinase
VRYFSLGHFPCPYCERDHPLEAEVCPASGATLDAVHKMGGTLLADRYRVREVIAEGGMGVIYRCEHRRMGSSMAVKFLSAAGVESREATGRFAQEARMAASISHPGIVRTFDLGVTQSGIPYMVMELLTGEDLAVRLARRGRLGPAEAVTIARQLLEALAAVHAMGIVHRDLKPENVFLSRQSGGSEMVKILDFGIGRLLRGRDVFDERGRRRVFGTPHYMSPEQASAARDLDHRADLWAVGVLLFEMLTGSTPFDGETAEDVMTDVLAGEPRDPLTLEPEVPPALLDVLERSLSKDVSLRYPDAAQMLAALLSYEAEAASPRPVRGGETGDDPEPGGRRSGRYSLIGGGDRERVDVVGARRRPSRAPASALVEGRGEGDEP